MTTIPTTIQERVPMPVAAGSPDFTSRSLTPADILAMLRRRLLTIMLLCVLFGACAVGMFFLLYFKLPKYTAEAYVECISDAPRKALSVEQAKLDEDPFLRFIKSQALFIKSPPILTQVLQDPEVRETNWFRAIKNNAQLLELGDRLSCSDIRDTNYIRVALSTRSVGDPHIIVNRVVDAYLAKVRDTYTNPFRQELNEYKRELTQIKEQIVEKQREIRDFAARIPPGNLPGEEGRGGGGAILDKLKTDQEIVANLELEVTELESLSLIYNDPAGAAITPSDRLEVEQDQRVASLDAQIFALDQEMSVLLRKFGASHREYVEMADRKKEAERQIGIARSNRLRELIEQKRQMIETARVNAQGALLGAKSRLQETLAEQADLEAKLADYARLLDDRDVMLEIKNRIDEYIRDIERIVRESGAVRVQSAVRATQPLERSFPKLLMLPAFVFVAVAAAVGLAIGLELIDTSVKTGQDIVRHLQLGMLGSVPDVDDEEVHIDRVESAVRDAPQSMVAEAFRTVRSNLQFSAPPDRMRSILITSPKPEDGRTTVAANLAASLAVAGRRVLLVDANFRRPALHMLYPQAAPRGMTNILVGETAAEACIQKTDLPNLDVVGSGPIPPNPAELLGGDLFRRFVTEVSQSYDHVLFDAPPVLLASDAIVLATAVDGVVLVCRAKDNSRGVALRATSLLTHAGAHLFGAVLNVAQARRGGYFREQQRAFYDYRSEEDEGAAMASRALPKGSAGDDDAADDRIDEA